MDRGDWQVTVPGVTKTQTRLSRNAPQGWYMVWHVCYTIAWGVKSQRGFPGGATGKEFTCQCKRRRFYSCVGKIPGGEHGNPHQYSCLENPPANAGDTGLTPGLERSLGVGSGNPLQYPCLENSTSEEPGSPQSIGSQRVRHKWSDLACMHKRTKSKQSLSR